eukprot:TRINITY_DN957_c0_g1_i1.p1 TRINITY_DN957_c0_g1~~TRINITY_DN957_c0_g1_i1.p1  ORF type:complete len:222 (+),score=41.65 TRINITY_DN957_c0_g1_i1:23-688(+)
MYSDTHDNVHDAGTDFVVTPDKGKKPIVQIQLDNNVPGFILKNVLSEKECKYLIEESEKLGYKNTNYPKYYRSNLRLMVNHPQLTDLVWSRVKKFLPETMEDGSDKVYTAVGLNERWRFCRYDKGHHFSAHYDGRFARGTETSIYTFMLYLNGGFEGGTTTFLEGFEADGTKNSKTQVVAPEPGLALVFRHKVYHEGTKLKSDQKYILRSDVMYNGALKKK